MYTLLSLNSNTVIPSFNQLPPQQSCTSRSELTRWWNILPCPPKFVQRTIGWGGWEVGGGLRVPFCCSTLPQISPNHNWVFSTGVGFTVLSCLPQCLFLFSDLCHSQHHTPSKSSLCPSPDIHTQIWIFHITLFLLLETLLSWTSAPGVALSLRLQSPGDLGRVWRRWQGLSPPSWCEIRFWILPCLSTYSLDWPVFCSSGKSQGRRRRRRPPGR